MLHGSCKAEQGTEAQLDRESHSLRAPETGTLSRVFLGAACMCTVSANKELTTTHGFVANLTLSSSGTRGARPDYSAKYSCFNCSRHFTCPTD